VNNSLISVSATRFEHFVLMEALIRRLSGMAHKVALTDIKELLN
jgi:hypothetical protein